MRGGRRRHSGFGQHPNPVHLTADPSTLFASHIPYRREYVPNHVEEINAQSLRMVLQLTFHRSYLAKYESKHF